MRLKKSAGRKFESGGGSPPLTVCVRVRLSDVGYDGRHGRRACWYARVEAQALWGLLGYLELSPRRQESNARVC